MKPLSLCLMIPLVENRPENKGEFNICTTFVVEFSSLVKRNNKLSNKNHDHRAHTIQYPTQSLMMKRWGTATEPIFDLCSCFCFNHSGCLQRNAAQRKNLFSCKNQIFVKSKPKLFQWTNHLLLCIQITIVFFSHKTYFNRTPARVGPRRQDNVWQD